MTKPSPLRICHACGNAYDPKRSRGAHTMREILSHQKPGTPQGIVDVDGKSYMLVDEAFFKQLLEDAMRNARDRVVWTTDDGADLPPQVLAAIPEGFEAGERWVEIKKKDGDR
jgi:hypothetical protein